MSQLAINRTTVLHLNIFTPESAKSKIDECYKFTNWIRLKTLQHHYTVLLTSFPMNGHTLGVCLLNQKLEILRHPRLNCAGCERV